ncbi:uncharacterized protein BT62DRAFT_984469 [Guyanagaster necrorhizus]|uniref:Ubiquinone biosynthesis protein n=1 Tax=Guyanagaster necrorhizus TaxID=856835 RepID=A0A9P7W337_9AGAR|nr:uncharacterized protein BT62DRAFT_984469 [Guyanagaster necrorhizus MCA 3950]KAG7451298.1 hypothetical protein BT62DRAFT_984469 [Guyanagaster necrorhizus MCA 3950]
MSRTQLLQLATNLVNTHGFTRKALAESVLSLPPGQAHPEPLSDTAVSALFGIGDDARRTLIHAWLDQGVRHMGTVPSPTLKSVLHARLRYNEPMLQHLPEAFALLASPNSGVSLLDPIPILKHSSRIADESCYISGDTSVQFSWYVRRASIAGIYGASELHQLTSPSTAYSFLDNLFDTANNFGTSLEELGLFSSYVFKSWKGIFKSKGIV